MRNSESIAIFKNRLLLFIRPVPSNVCNIFDPVGLKFLTRLRLNVSRLNEHRFRHNFQNCIKPLCTCSLEIEDTSNYLLHSEHFCQLRNDFMNSLNKVFENFHSLSDNFIREILSYRDAQLDAKTNLF